MPHDTPIHEEHHVPILRNGETGDEVACKSGRVWLPVAAACNLRCNFCERREDGPDENNAVLSPGQALAYLTDWVKRHPETSGAVIAGPGDPLADAEATLETLRLVRAAFPELLIELATNGLNLAPWVEPLKQLRLSQITLTINAVDPAVGARIYAWIRDGNRLRRGIEGAACLWERQAAALALLRGSGILVEVDSVIIPGINDTHLPEIARRVNELGVTVINCLPLSRADDSGRLNEDSGDDARAALHAAARLPLNPQEVRPYVAVATREGRQVNQHLGEADEFCIYAEEADGYRLVDTRPAPLPGTGRERWLELAARLRDCRALLVSGAGPSPRNTLTGKGVRVIATEGPIEDALGPAFRGDVLSHTPKQGCADCGMSCAGSDQECGCRP